MSYYTKYRPQTIAELDLVLARESLSHILLSGKFSQAYLFAGPKGTGKTSSARILAKVLNCEKNDNSRDREISRSIDSKKETIKQSDDQTIKRLHEPCNTCDNCVRITNGTSMACYEMDAASNRGIDDIRTLRDQVSLTPSEGRFIVYIIDEVHMLTTEAFNALLKTLEEPPAHAVFVLCTTHPQKIPDTVISRCTRIKFQKATPEEIASSLNKAVVGEKLQVDKATLLTIAGRVDGSFRDAMKTLEQLAQQHSTITAAMVNEATGYGDEYDVESLIKALIRRDAAEALTQINEKQEQGIDVGVFSKRLVEQLRELLIKDVQSRELLELTQRVSQAAVEVKSAVIPILPLEIAVVEWCLVEKLASVPVQPNYSEAKKEQRKEVVVEKPAELKVETIVAHTKVLGSYAGTIAEIKEKWQTILMTIRPLNHSLEALLRSARPADYGDGWLTIEAFYKFHKEQLEQDRNRKRLEETIGEVMGGTVYLIFRLMEKEKTVSDVKVENVTGKVEDDALVRAAAEILC